MTNPLRTVPMLHILNGDAPLPGVERSGIPGTFVAWPDVLHEGPTPLLLGDQWIRVRTRYLACDASVGEPLPLYRGPDVAPHIYRDYDEIVFWFEHDLYDQLLLMRYLWWRGGWDPAARTRCSLVSGDRYIGLLTPEQFPALFEARQPVSGAQIREASAAWEAFCAADPSGLVRLAASPSGDLPFLQGALRRHLEEFPSAATGLARTETQILGILEVGPCQPEELFRAVARTEERIFMGDSSFWTIVRRLASGAHPLVAVDVAERPGTLPTGLVRATAAGKAVLSGAADYVAMNGIDRWLGGAHLTSSRLWRWTGAALLPASS